MTTLIELLAEQKKLFAPIETNIAELVMQRSELEKQIKEKEISNGSFTVEAVKATKDLKAELSIVDETISLANAKRKEMVLSQGITLNLVEQGIRDQGHAKGKELALQHHERLEKVIEDLFEIISLFDQGAEQVANEALHATASLKKYLADADIGLSLNTFMAKNNAMQPLDDILEKYRILQVKKAYYTNKGSHLV